MSNGRIDVVGFMLTDSEACALAKGVLQLHQWLCETCHRSPLEMGPGDRCYQGGKLYDLYDRAVKAVNERWNRDGAERG